MTKLTETEKYQLIFEAGKQYLLSFEKVNEDMLYRHLHPKKLTTIEAVFERLLESLKNRPYLDNTVGEVEKLREVLYGFKPKEVVRNYSDWRSLFKRIKSEVKLKSGMPDIENEKSSWVKFCKGTIPSAKFLSRFDYFVEFETFVFRFYLDEFTLPALPWLIGSE